MGTYNLSEKEIVLEFEQMLEDLQSDFESHTLKRA